MLDPFVCDINQIEKMLDTFDKGDRAEQKIEVYEVYKILKKTKDCGSLPDRAQNFRMVKFRGESFYPILARERNYRGVLCLMARRVSLSELLMNVK